MKKLLLGLGFSGILLLSGCNGVKTHQVIAENDSASIDVGDSVVINVLSNDSATFTEDGFSGDSTDALEIGDITQPQHGAVIKDGQSIVYTHNGDTSESDSFTYEALIIENNMHFTDEAVVSITIEQATPPPSSSPTPPPPSPSPTPPPPPSPTPPPPSINKVPTANAGADKTIQLGESVTMTGTGSDSDGTIVSYKWMKGSTVLATTAEFVYTPTAVSSDTLIFTVTDDDDASASDTVIVEVTAASNTKPVADSSEIYMSSECTIAEVVSFTVTGHDDDGDTLTFTKVTDPTYGSVSVDSDGNGEFTLDDSEDQNKCMDGIPNSFSFNVNDGTENSDDERVDILPNV